MSRVLKSFESVLFKSRDAQENLPSFPRSDRGTSGDIARFGAACIRRTGKYPSGRQATLPLTINRGESLARRLIASENRGFDSEPRER